MPLNNSGDTEKKKENPTTPCFVYEPTGSATCINLDGKTEYGHYNLTDNNLSGGTGDNPLAE
ncbi:LAS seventeen-binding protein 3 [Desulfotomaculum sp. 1211_IL3151]|uniref:LAS seventeen-binding protein 3 n=1 Tax=Desulfotomaculum sp. 1211_IL3151 TaxID=3084055 RepID=UPI002FD9CE94